MLKIIREAKKEKILAYLNEAGCPIDVAKIQQACNIGNWLTALNYCLTLLAEGKIKGQKTSRGWIFWTHQKTELKPYEEAIGVYEDLQVNEDEVTLLLNVNKKLRLTFPTQSPEANILSSVLKDVKKGTKIALLRTDIPSKPLLIKVLDETTQSNNNNARIMSPEFYGKQALNKEAPKNRQKTQAPTTNLDLLGLCLKFGTFCSFLIFLLKFRGLF